MSYSSEIAVEAETECADQDRERLRRIELQKGKLTSVQDCQRCYDPANERLPVDSSAGQALGKVTTKIAGAANGCQLAKHQSGKVLRDKGAEHPCSWPSHNTFGTFPADMTFAYSFLRRPKSSVNFRWRQHD